MKNPTAQIQKILLSIFLLLTLPVAASAAEREFDMTIEEVQIEVAPGFSNKVFAFNGQVPGPLIHVQEGDDLTVHVTNNTALAHTVHWHGVNQIGSWKSDGVPDVTQPQIEPGERFTYKFKADRPGSLWYHCHVNVWEHVAIRGMWGPLIVDPKKPSAKEKKVTKDVIMMMSAWQSVYGSTYGKGGGPADYSDFFSVNAKSFPYSQPVRVTQGDVVRFRMYGAGDETHQMHLHGHDQLLSFKDGYPLPAPYYIDTAPVGPGERYDAIVNMNNPGLFIFHDHVDKHMSNNGAMLGGPVTIIEYDGVPRDSWYAWKDKAYDPDFFYSESMKKGYGIFLNPNFQGRPVEQSRRRK